MITIDTDRGIVLVNSNGHEATYELGTPEAFALVSQAWLRAGWDVKYVYSFTWLGRPIIQLPEDMFRLQELIYEVKPDVIVETGIAHGGSLIFYSSLFKSLGKGRVIGVDIDIRPHNREAIESHELFSFITLIEGSSIEPSIVQQVQSMVQPGETVMVCLDSNHTKAHVLAELNAYAPLVRPGSYIVAMDGIMEELVGAPRSSEDWSWNNPRQAALEFVGSNQDFQIEEPQFRFNESAIRDRITYWPSAFLRRVR